MPYPQAPWTLKGYAIQTVQLVDIEKARPLIPPEFDIVSLWPGKTLGGVYLSAYGLGSTMEYNELIVVAGSVSYKGQLGAWVSHIYVDNSDSVAGGREIWGLPKELAEFTWEKREGDRANVTVRQGNKQLCSLNYSQQGIAWKLPFNGNVFSALNSDILLFKGELEARIGLVSGKLEIPSESPFSNLDLGQPWLTLYCEDLRFVAGVPEVVGEREVAFSYS